MRLIAIKQHRYPANTLNTREIGDEYEATNVDAFVLVGAKLSKVAPTVGVSISDETAGIMRKEWEGHFVGVAPSYEIKEQKATPLPEDNPTKKKRQYKRRDMNPA